MAVELEAEAKELAAAEEDNRRAEPSLREPQSGILILTYTRKVYM